MSAPRRRAALLAVVALALAACDEGGSPVVESQGATTTAAAGASTTAAGTATSEPAASELLVLWPVAGEGTAAPEEAADSFMARFFPDSAVTFEPFAPGDGQSGEIDVLSGGEEGAGRLRATLVLRQQDERWHVIAAANPNVVINIPDAQAEVPAGPLTVEGVGRGFEATIVVTAELPDGGELATAVGAGGSQETAEPFTVDLDLTAAPAGATVALLAAGGTGLEADPGEFTAIPIRIG